MESCRIGLICRTWELMPGPAKPRLVVTKRPAHPIRIALVVFMINRQFSYSTEILYLFPLRSSRNYRSHFGFLWRCIGDKVEHGLCDNPPLLKLWSPHLEAGNSHNPRHCIDSIEK